MPWLENGHWPQRQAALEAVGALAARGDAAVIDCVLRRLSDPDESCRHAADEVRKASSEVLAAVLVREAAQRDAVDCTASAVSSNDHPSSETADLGLRDGAMSARGAERCPQ